MIASASPPKRCRPPLLETGDLLQAPDFLSRWEEMPGLKNAELIEGVVYLMAPLSAQFHGDPDSLIQGWLLNYSIATPGVKSFINSTVKLDAGNVPQPDGGLRILAEYGGRAPTDADGYLLEGPELVVEVTSRSVTATLRDKLKAYARHGIPEVIIWRTADSELEWLSLNSGVYERLAPDAEGILRSVVFPGLWLNLSALLREDGRLVMDTLNLGLKDQAHQVFAAKLAARGKPRNGGSSGRKSKP